VRIHPVEIISSTGVKALSVLVLGVAPLAVVIFEIVLNGTALFNHSNVRMPVALDQVLRWFIVTPDMHRIHHSTDVRETNSN
jgi:sterol desaturase/sphingolipid hydroxylase (fatty acid hydroxylase superfamily)